MEATRERREAIESEEFNGEGERGVRVGVEVEGRDLGEEG